MCLSQYVQGRTVKELRYKLLNFLTLTSRFYPGSYFPVAGTLLNHDPHVLLEVQRSPHMGSAGGLRGKRRDCRRTSKGLTIAAIPPVVKWGELRGLTFMPGESQGVQRLHLLSWRKPVFFILIRLCRPATRGEHFWQQQTHREPSVVGCSGRCSA